MNVDISNSSQKKVIVAKISKAVLDSHAFL
jgi:hypothetical protein